MKHNRDKQQTVLSNHIEKMRVNLQLFFLSVFGVLVMFRYFCFSCFVFCLFFRFCISVCIFLSFSVSVDRRIDKETLSPISCELSSTLTDEEDNIALNRKWKQKQTRREKTVNVTDRRVVTCVVAAIDCLVHGN